MVEAMRKSADVVVKGMSAKGTETDPVTGAPRVGRFGLKAEKVSVAHEVADEAAESLGVTTSVFPDAQNKAELSAA